VGLRLDVRLAQRWVLCAGPLDFSGYWNELWVLAWTPYLGAGLVF
jgi:hypothetical protein